MIIKNQFIQRNTLNYNSGKTHPGYVNEKPLSIAEMMRRAQNGIPLSVPKLACDRIPLNNRYFTDDFDILDFALANESRMRDQAELIRKGEQEKREQLRESEEQKKQQDLDLTKSHAEVPPGN